MVEQGEARVGTEGPLARVLVRLLEGLAALNLLALMVLTCVDVTGRYLFNAPLDGAVELTRLLMAAVIFSALPVVSWREQHVSVDLMDLVFPRRWINARQAAMNAVAAVALAVVAWRVWILAARAAEYGDETEYLEIPLAPFAYFMSVMSAVTALALAVNVARYLAGRGPMSPAGGR